MRRIFGTDGIRGRANAEPMTAETALKVAQAAIAELRDGDHHHRVVIGKDTRLSGYMNRTGAFGRISVAGRGCTAGRPIADACHRDVDAINALRSGRRRFCFA